MGNGEDEAHALENKCTRLNNEIHQDSLRWEDKQDKEVKGREERERGGTKQSHPDERVSILGKQQAHSLLQCSLMESCGPSCRHVGKQTYANPLTRKCQQVGHIIHQLIHECCTTSCATHLPQFLTWELTATDPKNQIVVTFDCQRNGLLSSPSEWCMVFILQTYNVYTQKKNHQVVIIAWIPLGCH